jgi:hypothetical protein
MNGESHPAARLGTARGWLPLAAKVGNVVVVTLDAPLAWRLGEAFQIDPFAPLKVNEAVESALRDYLDEVVPT